MPNVGTITGSMYLDPSAYVAGLNTAAGATRSFQQGVATISFAGFNRGIFATTTLLYGLERIMSNMSKGMEEYANMLGRIGTVADLTAASVSALADSMKQISVYQGVSRKDIMGGMYTAAQAGYETPAEMRAMAASGARLSRASGKEIDVKKSVDLQSGIRQALGIGMGSVSSNRMNDILLRGRDIGRWELDEMAQALGIPLTVWGNQFAGRQSGEETLRQLLSVMSVASLAGVSPRMTATGTRRIVEKTLQLNKSGKVGDPLRNALRGAGFGGQEPILDALNQGGIRYLNTLMNVTGGGQTSELTRLGYGSRDLLVLTSALRGKAEKLNRTYEELSYGNAAGTTERYGEKMRQTYDYSRDRLRAQWEITSQQFMQASIPLIGQFTNMLEGFNKVAQALPDSVKSFMLLIGALSAARLALNYLGFRVGKNGGTSAIMGSTGGVGKAGMGTIASMMAVASSNMRQNVSPADAQAARLARRQSIAASRPYSHYLTHQSSPSWQGTSPVSDSAAPNSLAALGWLGMQSKYGVVEERRLEVLRNRYAPMTSGGIPMVSSKYGPTLEQRIRWAAYRQGQSVDFGTGAYGSLSPSAQYYFGNRGQTQGSLSVREQNAFAERNRYYGSLAGKTAPIIGNMRNQLGYSQGFKMMLGRDNLERVLGSVTSGLSVFGAAITRLLGPMALLTVAMSAISAFYSGWNYTGRQGEKEGGLTKMKGSGGGFTPILDPFSFAFRSLGSAANNKGRYLGELKNEYAREHNYIPMDFKNMQPEDIPGYKPGMNKKWWLFKEVTKAIAGGTPLGLLVRSIFPGERPLGLEGYRRVNMKDVMNAARTEQLSESELTKFQKLGIDVNNVESGKRYLNDYAKELGYKPPKDWESLVRQTKDGLTTYGQMAADAFRFAAKKIEDAATKAAAEIENLSIKNRLTGYTANVGKYIGFVSGQETLMNLEGMQKTPFQPEKDAKWLAAYKKALSVYSGIYDTPRFKDKDILSELSGIEDVAGKGAAKGIAKPFNDVLGMNARLTASDFFAKYGPQLGNSKLVTDEMISGAVGLDRKNMSPEMTKSIISQIRGLDYTSWTQTFEPQKAPFSQALQYGTKEGYNATLERKDSDPVVQILRSKLDAVISAIVAKERDDDQKQSDFAEALGKVISEAMKPLAENEQKNMDLFVSKLSRSWSDTITDPIVTAIQKPNSSADAFPATDRG